MNKFDEMARQRVMGGMTLGALLGFATGAYLTLRDRGIAIWLAGAMAVVQLLIYHHQQRSEYYKHLRDNQLSPKLSAAKHWVLMVVDFLLGYGFSAAVTGLVGATVYWLLYELPGRYVNLVALAVLPAGYAASYFKRRDQSTYGTVEVLAGAITALATTAKAQIDPATQSLAIIGAVYVVARGFNNIAEAKEKIDAISKGSTEVASPS